VPGFALTWMMSTDWPLPRSMGTDPKDGATSWSGDQTQGSVACEEGHRSCGVMEAAARLARAACVNNAEPESGAARLQPWPAQGVLFADGRLCRWSSGLQLVEVRLCGSLHQSKTRPGRNSNICVAKRSQPARRGWSRRRASPRRCTAGRYRTACPSTARTAGSWRRSRRRRRGGRAPRKPAGREQRCEPRLTPRKIVFVVSVMLSPASTNAGPQHTYAKAAPEVSSRWQG